MERALTFKEKYTTEDLIVADKDGIEVKKRVVSEGDYALCELIEALVNEIRKRPQ